MSHPSVAGNADSDFLPASRPSLPDLESCEEWLTTASMGDSRQACAAFILQIGELAASPPRHAIYLQILERLRPLAKGALIENARRFAGKAVPLSPTEQTALQQAFDLCRVMMRSYRRLLRAATRSEPPTPGSRELHGDIALLAARTIEFAGLQIDNFYRARHDVPDECWRLLHECYSTADTLGVSQVALGQPGRHPRHMETAMSLYVRPLLQSMAHPYGLPLRESQWLRGWLRKWSAKVLIVNPGRSRPSGDQAAWGFDINGTAAPHWMPADAAGHDDAPDNAVRRLDTTELRRSLRKRLLALEAGKSPSEIGLGADCVQPAAGELLKVLLNTWCSAPATPRFPRRAATQGSTAVVAAAGLVGAHAVISGKAFEQEVRIWDYTRRGAAYQQSEDRLDANALATAAPTAPDPVAVAEAWQLVDESAVGFRLIRQSAGARLAQRQLLAVRPHGASQFILSEVRWLTQGCDQSVTVGTQALPGLATPCAVRPATADPSRPAAFVQALLLSVGRGLPPTLVLPSGSYQPERVLELRMEGGIRRIRLSGLAGRGYDYDRVAFSASA